MRTAIALGADGWMDDFGEWLHRRLTAAGPSLGRHNLYPVGWHDGARGHRRRERRAGAALLRPLRRGSARAPLMDVMWPGDQLTDFDPTTACPASCPSASGWASWASRPTARDIGGYQGGHQPSTKELFFRWTALGAFPP